MSTLIIKGGKKLNGEIKISGMKNAATPILAATLLATQKCIIDNVPDIADVRVMIDILRSLGSDIDFNNNTVVVNPGKIDINNLNGELVKKLRSSILIIGPLLARLGEVSLPEPGGCIIGKRPIDTHLFGLERLGAKIEQKERQIIIKSNGLVGTDILLPEFSVTATENLIMVACLADGTTTIKLAATEPHVEDLISFLNKMGADIKIGLRNTITIKGVKELKGTDYKIIPDSIEVGTFAVAALVTKSKITLKGVNHDHLDAVYSLLERIGATLEKDKDSLTIYAKNKLKAFKLQALPFPGFPTDLQAPFGVLATQCDGISLIHDPLYEGRLGHIRELEKMGAYAVICDLHRVAVSGITSLVGTIIKGLDLRAGATLVIAGLVASGTTTVQGIENLDRGYENFDERLRLLGAEIERKKE